MNAPRTDAHRELNELRLEVEELRASRRRIVLAADADRRGFERALHTGLQQQLVGLAADLELAARSVEADPSSAMSLLAEMRGELQRALEQSRTLAHRIAPPLLEAGGLLVSLRSAAANAESPSRIEVTGGATVPPELATAVYSCFVEALERAEAGTSVGIAVREGEGTLLFDLTAEGRVDTDGWALVDRIEALGGELAIRSGPGDRTTWAGTLPLPR